MTDNTEIKDGLGNEFTLRTKDISPAQDGSLRRAMTYSTGYPIDYGAGGCYVTTLKSGTMAAGLAAASPILSFYWTSATLFALLRRIKMSVWSYDTGFAAGVGNFNVFAARGFTAADTGGGVAAMSSNNAKLRTSMATSAVQEIRYSSVGTLTAGTRTKDTNPFASWDVGLGTATYSNLNGTVTVYSAPQGEHPFLMTVNEGFVIEATVPATGTWRFAITPEWDECPLF